MDLLYADLAGILDLKSAAGKIAAFVDDKNERIKDCPVRAIERTVDKNTVLIEGRQMLTLRQE